MAAGELGRPGRGRLVLITGGARSGKSELAESMAAAAAGEGGRVVYVATAAALDEEMRQRVESHRRRRPAAWRTVEEELDVVGVVAEYGREPGVVVLVDCLTVLAANLLQARGEERALADLTSLAVTAGSLAADVILVANEVGLGLVPDNPLGRAYRDLFGRVQQAVAQEADEVYLVWAGLVVTLKGPGAAGQSLERVARGFARGS